MNDRSLLLAFCLVFFSALMTAPVGAQEGKESLMVFLVRHAEKADASRDPELSAAGVARGKVLAATLRSSGVTRVHSSDYKRTRNTAAPVSKALGVTTRLYDPRDLPGLVKRLRAAGGRHLVVGHSNTTPGLAKLLGGEPGAPIDEKGEYDRLYVVTIGADDNASSVLLRYGEPFGRGE